eukprot:TRINITY_DN104_c0_g1_i2.p1 TRINITY_DN104_c0_g1~~TRINITY_DN104_c0_g1_i2.p1  ORF type:complete len:726 (+),score=368.00 TRINITY_DN104_c0_g1_i2:53-2179(+)
MARGGKKTQAPKGKVHYEVRECDGKRIAVMTLDNPPMNPLSMGIRVGLNDHLKTAVEDTLIDGIVVTGANGTFCAGADISEFSGGMRGPNIADVINRYEASPKPVVAAIDGVALGGGCEVALGCQYRIATPRSMVGLPEVNLGLLPGAGGTQRMPRLVGAEQAIELMCKGAPLNSQQALQLGIFDEVSDRNIVAAGVQLCASVATRGVDLRNRALSRRNAIGSPAVFEAARKKWGKFRKGEVAPQAIIKCAEAATRGSFKAGMATEREEFMKLMMGDQSKAMQYMFFADRACWKVPGLTTKPAPLKTVGIIGAGLMGGGIAMCCANAGMKVILVDAKPEFLEKGMKVIGKTYETSVKRGSMKEGRAKKAFSNITAGGTDYAVFKDCDMVIEAVYENMDIKKEVFGRLDQVCKKGCILATNTSYLSIDEIASATSRPEDVVGCHFFSPANVMKLLENVRGSKTSARTIATAMAFGKRIGKVCVLVNNCWGFVANRMMAKQGATQLLYSGYLPHEIDAAAEKFGMRMGPMRMSDLVGLDLGARERERNGTLKPEEEVVDFLYKQGNYGMKTGKGLYVYDAKRRATPNPEVASFLQRVWTKSGVTKPALTEEQVAQRIYMPVVNEGFRCLEEGIVSRASDIDVALVYGYNFPRFTGGPMKYADLLGLDEVVKVLRDIGEEPCQLLKKLAEEGSTAAHWSKLREEALNKAKL